MSRHPNRTAAPSKGRFNTSSVARPRNTDLGGEDSMRGSGGALRRNLLNVVKGVHRPLQDRGGKR